MPLEALVRRRVVQAASPAVVLVALVVAPVVVPSNKVSEKTCTLRA